jgi:hypothetical protein
VTVKRDDLGLRLFAIVMTPLLWPALLYEYARYKPFHRAKNK